MNWKMAFLAALAAAALVVAAVALAIAYSVANQNHASNPALPEATASPTLQPTDNPVASLVPTATPSSTPTAVALGNVELAGTDLTHTDYTTVANERTITGGSVASSTISPTTSATGIAYSNIQILSVGSYCPQYTSSRIESGTLYQFSVNVTNPSTDTAPPNPCCVQFTLTEINPTQPATSTDASLQVYTEGKEPIYGAPDAAYSFFTPITGTANGNTLTFLFAPSGEYYQPGISGLSSSGFTISHGFNESFSMQLALAITGTFNLDISVVAAT